jgi:hypothetical protein
MTFLQAVATTKVINVFSSGVATLVFVWQYARNRRLLFECRSRNRMAFSCENLCRSTFASKRQFHSRRSPNSSMSAKVESNLIGDENHQPIGRPWPSMVIPGNTTACRSALHAAELNCKGRRRRRWPVTAKIALATAGAIGGSPGSPIPPGSS